jgi:hypothetical protein
MANIVTNIVLTRWNEDSLYRNVDVKLDFADCTRCVSMDMYIGTDEYDNENALHKVDTLIEVLTDFRKALKKEIKIQEKLSKKRKKKKGGQ